MAKKYVWTPDTPTGFLNDELEALWTDVDANTSGVATNAANIASNDTDIANLTTELDEARYEVTGPSGEALQTSGSYTNIFHSPAVELVDAATKVVRFSYIFPEYLIGVASAVDVAIRWWLMDNVASAANYEYEGAVNKWTYPSGNPGTAILTVSPTVVASPAASAYRLFYVDFSVSSVTWSNIVGLSAKFQRNGSAANDTATSSLYLMGTRLTFTPN